jgi:PIN domain nuclease of toxin-antitoxin system
VPKRGVTEFVLDASALLAALFDEEGADRVEEILARSVISAVNVSEVFAKLQDRGVPDPKIDAHLAELDLDVIPFDVAQAALAGRLRRDTKAGGLSLGDRCCLALAIYRGGVAVTTDRAWSQLSIPAKIEVIR